MLSVSSLADYSYFELQSRGLEQQMQRLSPREAEVFYLIGQGMSTREVANILGGSSKTVETYRDRIRSKLNLINSVAVVCLATQWCLRHGEVSALIYDRFSLLDELSETQKEVLMLIGDGMNTKEIVAELHLTHNTIETYKERIKAKLRLKNANALQHYAAAYSFFGERMLSSDTPVPAV